jgi:hypothetical protein
MASTKQRIKRLFERQIPKAKSWEAIMAISIDLIEMDLTDCYREAAKKKIRSHVKGDQMIFTFKDGSTLNINYDGREATAHDGNYSVRREYR